MHVVNIQVSENPSKFNSRNTVTKVSFHRSIGTYDGTIFLNQFQKVKKPLLNVGYLQIGIAIHCNYILYCEGMIGTENFIIRDMRN